MLNDKAMEIQNIPAFSAFESQLKTLCLKEFPCGAGTWRETKPATKKTQKHLTNKLKVESQFSVTLKDFGAQHEKTETLQEYVGSIKSPWNLDYSWSSEAQQLREISVKSPWLIDNNFVLNHFKTLRIVNKGVTEIDPDLLKFQNLEELTLSCNYISNINSKNLPPNLKVLEICGNAISDLTTLCIKPPKLIHLGLGFNRISLIGDYLTKQYWPYLLSLDLSNNNLNDLLDVVNKLGSLPKLRNIVLQGNPLSLIPGYRGYTVDSLKKLSVLDDIMISADERHYYKGLSRRREYILDEAKIKLGVTYIKGIPTPEELKNPEDQPEFPVIERKYFVQFMFLEDATLKSEGDQIEQDDDLNELQELALMPSDQSDIQDMTVEEGELDDPSMVEKNVYFTQEPDELHTIEKAETHEVEKPPSPAVTEKTIEDEETTEKILKLAPVNSEKLPWGEEIECNWSQMVVRDDLIALRDFLKQGMEISVVEEMVLCYPVIPEELEDGSAPNPKSSRRGSSRARQESRGSRGSRIKVKGYPAEGSKVPVGKSAGKNKKENKETKERKEHKETKEKKSGGKDKGGDKKKKKEPEQELKKNPPTYQTLATWHVPLAEFLEGEFEYQSVYTQGNIEIANTIRSVDTDSVRKSARSRSSGWQSGKMSGRSVSRSSRQEGRSSRRHSRSSRSGLTDGSQSKPSKTVKEMKETNVTKDDFDGKKPDSKDKGKKPGSAKKKEEGKDKSKDRKPSASKAGKDGKGDKAAKGGKAPVVPDEEEDQGPPPPLEIHITVNLHHWKTAMDLLKDEEEKKKLEEESVPVIV